MEYLIIILFGFLIVSGNKEEPKPVEPAVYERPKPVVSEGPVFKPNYYVRDAENGYYTSDLSSHPEPVQQVTSHQDTE